VRKVLLELKDEGFINIYRGSGAFVSKSKEVKELRQLFKGSKTIINEALRKARKADYIPSVFAGIILEEAKIQEKEEPAVIFAERSKTLAMDIASQINDEVPVHITGIEIKELKKLLKTKDYIHYIITTFFYYVELKKLIENENIHITFISYNIEETLKTAGKGTAFLTDETDTKIFNDYITHKVENKEMMPDIIPYSEETIYFKTVEKYKKVYVSPSIWDGWDETKKADSKFAPVLFFLDKRTLSDYKELLGIILKII